MADNLDRNKMYAADAGDSDGDYELAPIDDGPVLPAPPRRATSDDEDDGELELEPVDADILAAEKRRAAEAIHTATKAININEIYRDTEPIRDLELSKDLADRFRFQFQLKHLLIATAVLAIFLTLMKLLGAGLVVVLTFMISVFGASAYFYWEERKRQAIADQRRQQMYAERRAHFSQAGAYRNAAPSEIAAQGDRPTATIGPQVESVRLAVRPPIRFQFSLAQFMIASVCAAVLLAIVTSVGGAQPAAIVFGILALVGVIVHALGYDPPEIVAFTWWVLLVLYVLISVFSAIRGIFF
jgi:hypothetical protein